MKPCTLSLRLNLMESKSWTCLTLRKLRNIMMSNQLLYFRRMKLRNRIMENNKQQLRNKNRQNNLRMISKKLQFCNWHHNMLKNHMTNKSRKNSSNYLQVRHKLIHKKLLMKCKLLFLMECKFKVIKKVKILKMKNNHQIYSKMIIKIIMLKKKTSLGN